MNRRLAPVVAVMLSVAGCTSGVTPTSPTLPTMSVAAVSPAGNWSGAINDAISGSGTLQLSLSEQAPNSLTGTWSASFTSGSSFSGFAVAGLYLPTGYGIILYVNPPPACATSSGSGVGPDPVMFPLINVVATSSQLTAVWGRLSCSGSNPFGTVNLSKQ